MSDQQDKYINTELGGCRIISKTGSGGMGAVYLAHHLGLDKPVCVKILAPELARDERYVQFFLREARSAAKLEHPNIVHILNVGKEGDVHFIVMAYIKGENLSDIIDRDGPLPVDKATDIITGVLKGLAAAHEKSIIHRDIKPSNILITEAGIPKIVDFGLARSVNEEKQLTIAGEMMGTAYFMAPEQGLGNTVDHRADLYAAGATFYYILTSKYPFDGKTAMDVIHKHICEPLPDILLARPDVPVYIHNLIEKLIRKNPKDRFLSAQETLDAITKERGGAPPPAEAPALIREQMIEVPSLTERLRALQSEESEAPSAAAETPEPKTAKKAEGRVRVVSAKMRRTLNLALHFAMTSAAGTAFFLLGCLNTAPSKNPAEAFNTQLAAQPAVTLSLVTFGSGLLLWALMLKRQKQTPAYLLLTICGVLLFYSSGLTAAAQNSSLSERAWSVLAGAVPRVAAGENMPVYAVSAFLTASCLISGFRVTLSAGLAGTAFTALSFAALWRFGQSYAFPDCPPNFLIFAAAFFLALAGIFLFFSGLDLYFLPRPSIIILAALAVMYVFSVSPYTACLAREKAAQKARETESVIQITSGRGQTRAEYDDAKLLEEESARSYEKAVRQLAASWKIQKQAWRKALTVPLLNLIDRVRENGTLPLASLLVLLLTNVYFLKDLSEYDEWICRTQQ